MIHHKHQARGYERAIKQAGFPDCSVVVREDAITKAVYVWLRDKHTLKQIKMPLASANDLALKLPKTGLTGAALIEMAKAMDHAEKLP